MLSFITMEITQQESKTFRVSRLKALRHFFGWIRNPVSLEGASQVPKIKMAAGAPEFCSRIEDMKRHPDGQRILADRPDLGLRLSDESLADLPEGSLGRRYHSHANAAGAVPGYLLEGLVYRGPEYEQLDWDDDMKFLLHRMASPHDLVHILSGYRTDLAGESMTIAYTMGLEALQPGKTRLAAQLWSYISWGMTAPSIGFSKFRKYVMEAFERGVATARTCAIHNMYFEELLPLPLDHVRKTYGVPPCREPFDTRNWELSKLGKKIARGYRSQEERKQNRIAWIDSLVDAGIPVKTLVNLEENTLDALLKSASEGASKEDLRSLAGLH